METFEVPNKCMISLKELKILASSGPKGRVRIFEEVLYVNTINMVKY